MAFLHSDNTGVDVSASAPQATNYIDMLHKVIAFATNSSVATIVLNVGGTGYAVGDIVEIDNGTHPAVLAGAKANVEVLTLSGSAIATFRLRDAGSYTVNPAATETSNALSGGGSGATFDLTYASNGWTVDRQTSEITAAVIGATAGTGYSVGDTLELSEGDSRSGFAAPQSTNKGILTTQTDVLSGTAFTVTDGGIFHRPPPTNEAVTAVLSAAGSPDGLMTADLTFTNITDTTTPIEVWMTSSDGASVGIRTFTNASNIFNWEIAAAPTYTAANNFDEQVGMSNGRYPLSEDGSYVVLDNGTFNYYMNVTDRRITCVFNVDNGVYTNMYLGKLDPYSTTAEYAYPVLVGGCASRSNFSTSTVAEAFAGMNCAIAEAVTDDGPLQLYTPGGSWIPIKNGFHSGSDVAISEENFHIIPGGSFDPQNPLLATANQGPHRTLGQKQDWGSFANVATTGSGATAPPTETFRPTPTTGDDSIPMFECLALGVEPITLVAGELSDVRYLDNTLTAGTLNAEDLVQKGTDLWVVFNNCKLTARQYWFALKVSP